MAILKIIRGLPGSGKSTYGKSLNILHVERDMFCMKNGEYIWKAEDIQKHNDLCKTIISIALLNGNDCVVCGPFPKKEHVKEFINLALSFNAEYEVIRMTKEYGSSHYVPLEHMEKFRNEFEDFENEIIY